MTHADTLQPAMRQAIISASHITFMKAALLREAGRIGALEENMIRQPPMLRNTAVQLAAVPLSISPRPPASRHAREAAGDAMPAISRIRIFPTQPRRFLIKSSMMQIADAYRTYTDVRKRNADIS